MFKSITAVCHRYNEVDVIRSLPRAAFMARGERQLRVDDL